MTRSVLLADGVDIGSIIQILLFMAFLVGPVLMQFLKAQQKAQRGQRPAARPRPAVKPQARVEDEIEAFLRQARQPAQQQQPAAQQPPDPQPVRAQAMPVRPQAVPVEVVPREPLPPPAPRQLVQSRPDEGREPGQRLGTGVSDHVESHMAEGRVTEHASHLGEKIGTSDERFESRLKSSFDHDLGDLKSTTELPQDDQILEGTDADVWQTDDGVSEVGDADRLIELLRRPGGMRDALILTEIFNRRSDRW